MGIDLLDVVFRIERRFGIEIERGQGGYFLTPAQITWLVTEKLHGRNPAVPDLVAMLKRIESTVEAMPGYPRPWFRKNDLNQLIPFSDRERNWTALGVALGVPLPPLESSAGFDPRTIPKSVASSTSLISWIMQNHPEQMIWTRPATVCEPPPDAERWTNETIWDEVKAAIVDALGVDEDEVTPTARMVEDLGAE